MDDELAPDTLDTDTELKFRRQVAAARILTVVGVLLTVTLTVLFVDSMSYSAQGAMNDPDYRTPVASMLGLSPRGPLIASVPIEPDVMSAVFAFAPFVLILCGAWVTKVFKDYSA